MIALLVNIEEHFFDTQFIHPFVNDKLDKKSGGWSKDINPNREKYSHKPIRYGGINLSDYLVNQYIFNIESKDEVA